MKTFRSLSCLVLSIGVCCGSLGDARAGDDLASTSAPWWSSPASGAMPCTFPESCPNDSGPEDSLEPGAFELPPVDLDRLVSDDGRPYWRTSLLKRVARDQLFLVTTWWPAEARQLEFAVPMLVAAAGVGSSANGGVDARLQRFAEDSMRGGRHDVAASISRIGDLDTAIAVVGSTYIISRWAGNDRLSRASSLSAEALINTALYTKALKALSRRSRPATGDDGRFFGPKASGDGASSFPSGHAAGSFAVAAVVAAEYRDRRWVPWVAYGTAGLVAWSRVGLGRHYPSDILAGAVLGRSIGRMVAERGGIAGEELPSTTVEPVFDPETGGVGVSYHRRW